jgi:ribosomal protein L11 methyltransferase
MDLVYCVHFDTPAEDLAMLDELVATLDLIGASWQNVDTGEAWLRVFADDEAAASAILAQIQNALPGWRELLSTQPTPEVRAIQREDWAECWKEHFHAFRASRRLIVKPSWETFAVESEADILLELDPGMSFGTGYHGTTRACLEFMDDLSNELGPVSFLEAGCGSGILSLAAVKLGFEPVVAFDHDPQAVECARENLSRAGAGNVATSTSELAAFEPPFPFAVVAANILAHVLDTYTESVVKFVVPGGYLILAGILTPQYPGVKARYEALGCRELRTRTIDEWTSGVYRCPPQG